MMHYSIPKGTNIWRWRLFGVASPGTPDNDSRWSPFRTTKRVTYTATDIYKPAPELTGRYYFRLPDEATPFQFLAVNKEYVVCHPEPPFPS